MKLLWHVSGCCCVALLIAGCGKRGESGVTEEPSKPVATPNPNADRRVNSEERTKAQEEEAKKAVPYAKDGRELKQFLEEYPKAKLVSEKDGGVKWYSTRAVNGVYVYGFFGDKQLFHRFVGTTSPNHNEAAATCRVLERRLGKPDDDQISDLERDDGVVLKRVWHFPGIGHDVICKGMAVEGKGVYVVREIVYTNQMDELQKKLGK